VPPGATSRASSNGRRPKGLSDDLGIVEGRRVGGGFACVPAVFPPGPVIVARRGHVLGRMRSRLAAAGTPAAGLAALRGWGWFCGLYFGPMVTPAIREAGGVAVSPSGFWAFCPLPDRTSATVW
jgi:hypothetical protein